jgi:hypothetical protein
VRLTVGDQVMEQSLTLLTDPRVTAGGTSDDAIDRQVSLQLQIVDLLGEARQLAHRLEQELKEPGDRDSARRTAIRAALDELVTAKGMYMQPMLIDQIGYLGYMLRNADQEPGRDAFERLDELTAQLAAVRAGL